MPGIAHRLTQRVKLARKRRTGTSPETWEFVGSPRRCHIWRLSDVDSLAQGATYDERVTHNAWVPYADDYEPENKGSRLLVRQVDEQNFLILGVTEAGPGDRAGRTKFLALSLSAVDPPLKRYRP